MPHRQRRGDLIGARRERQRVAGLRTGDRICERCARRERPRACRYRTPLRRHRRDASLHRLRLARHRLQVTRRADRGERRIGRIEQAVGGAFERDVALLDTRAAAARLRDLRARHCPRRRCRRFRPRHGTGPRPSRRRSIALEPAVHRRRRTLGIGACSECDARAVDDAVALDPRVRDLMIAVDHRIGHAVHHADRALERGAREALEIIARTIWSRLITRTPPVSATPLPRKILRSTRLPLPWRSTKAPCASSTRFSRMMLPPDLIETISTSPLVRSKMLRSMVVFDADSDSSLVPTRIVLAAVRTERRARAEIIVIDAVAVVERIAGAADDRERHAAVRPCPRNANDRRGCRCRRAQPRCPRRGGRPCCNRR